MIFEWILVQLDLEISPNNSSLFLKVLKETQGKDEVSNDEDVVDEMLRFNLQ
jgi:hypothetical protein